MFVSVCVVWWWFESMLRGVAAGRVGHAGTVWVDGRCIGVDGVSEERHSMNTLLPVVGVFSNAPPPSAGSGGRVGAARAREFHRGRGLVLSVVRGRSLGGIE